MGFECVDVNVLYAKDDKLKREDVQILQEWLKKQPHLPTLREMQVAAFLHSCYYKIEATKKTIDNYFTKKTHHPELFERIPEENLRKLFSTTFITILPSQTPQKFGILLLKLLDYRADNFNFLDHINTINMISTLYLHQKGFENGGVIVFDSKGFTLAHLTKFNLSVMKHSLEHVQEGAPLRLKGIHFINTVPVLDKALALIRPFVKPEIFNALQLHSSLDTFYKFVPQDCLPEDYGGKLPSCQMLQEESLKNLLDNYDFCTWHDSQKVDETKRLGRSRGDTYGVQGTFKKLALD